ncbi:hypothetical protein BDF20DRAFT_823622 [Mycotypha africana]|uniref:uncharacterized protein n=1 Tax=Mycotypha africana TaxID=64632 RepID=UPI002300DC61|nr:uncharacterized protein BDF20DRAFT_823622 [Mycotypha africana]KAI8973821.1 hypothetical protein BDF20DRAFT_823622 [Mycotypha africana]
MITTTTRTGDSQDSDGKTLRPCCSCPETKKARDACVLANGDEHESCKELVEKHLRCMRNLGFKV